MPPSWTNLPCELVEKLFSEVHYGDILELQHICQTWRPAAQERLYTDIQIPANAESRELLVQTLSIPGSKAKYLVKSIFITSLGHGKSTSLVAICSLCPNITSISIPRPTKQFYRVISQLREAQHLKKIQCITDPSTECIDDYSKLMLLIKDSATEINILNDPSLVIPERGSVINSFPLAKHLKEFSCLEKVNMTASTCMALSQFDELLDMCPNNQINMIKLTLPNNDSEQQRRRLSAANQTIVKPQRTLSCVNELTIQCSALLKDQDMRYIMDKFPALQSLTILLGSPDHFQSDEHDSYARSNQSIDTVTTFINYLWRISCFDVQGFRSAPEMMSKVISQICKSQQVTRISLGAIFELEPRLLYLDVKRSLFSKGEIGFRIPQGMESVYQYVVSQEAFASQVNALDLSGSGSTYDIGGHLPTNDERKIAESQALVDCLEYAINNYTGLKSLTLAFLNLCSTFFSAESKRRLRLEDLDIMKSFLNAETWNMLSKRLEYVGILNIEMYPWTYDNPPQEDVTMPHTTLGEIRLYAYYLRFVNICTSSFNTYIDFDQKDQPNLLTEEQYHKMIAESGTDIDCYLKIVCKEWSSLTVEGVTFHNL